MQKEAKLSYMWGADVPGECFSYLFDQWKKRNNNDVDIEEMNSFLKKECGKWAQEVINNACG